MLRVTHPELGFIEPCLPSPAKAPPSGPGWLHEIKHDGFRIMARRDGAGVRLITRSGNDFSSPVPCIARSICLSWTVGICGGNQLKSESTYSPSCSKDRI